MRPTRCVLRLVATLALLTPLPACSEDVQLLPETRDAAVTPPSPPPADVTADEHCEGASLGLRGARPGCASLAPVAASHALCVCGDAVLMGQLTADAFDSRIAPYSAPGGDRASVGLDGALVGTGGVDVTGSWISAGPGLLPITVNAFRVGQDLITNSDLTVTNTELTVGGDLWVHGEVLAVNATAEVAGDVHQPPDHGQSGLTIGGSVVTTDFNVEPPCACEDEALIDVTGAVAAAREHNDNAAQGIASDVLYTEGAAAISLPCGRFLLASGALALDRTLSPRGRVTLFVDGDLTLAAALALDPEAEGTVELFVAGNLILVPGAALGAPERPGALSIYVAGTGDIVVPDALRFAANLYAPRATLYATSDQTFFGALFVEAIIASGAHHMHHDRSSMLEALDEPTCTARPPYPRF